MDVLRGPKRHPAEERPEMCPGTALLVAPLAAVRFGAVLFFVGLVVALVAVIVGILALVVAAR